MTQTMSWERDSKVLRAIYELEQENLSDRHSQVEVAAIEERSGVGPPALTWILGQLHAGDYIEAIDVSTLAKPAYLVEGIKPKGLEAIGEWPSPSAVAAVLPALLKDLAADQPDLDERHALQRIAENVTTGTLTALVIRYLPWLQ